jgi:thiol-disulfide isomerase/thioredoxin
VLRPFQFLFIALLSVITACNKQSVRPVQGDWQILFSVQDVQIPINLKITSTEWQIHNAEEVISLHPVWHPNDSFCVDMPLFHTRFCGRMLADTLWQGEWVDESRQDKPHVPLQARHRKVQHNLVKSETTESIWDCTFSPDNANDLSRAVGIFRASNGLIQGTFLTETGDYRYLQGLYDGTTMTLSCFDGTHLFYFTADHMNDSLLNGQFYSGLHWKEKWIAELNPQAQLRDPDSLTIYKSADSFKFTVTDVNNKSVTFDSASFRNHVTIVQIFGSWCPNCTDESKFLKEVYDAYNSAGLQIIPVAFERSAPKDEQLRRIQRQFKDLGLSYPPYLGGESPKNQAQLTFPQLDHIMSYPTTIFIDKKSQVRKIHTGFYGPGTGKYYVHHKEQLLLFIEQLLAEN